MLLSKYSTQLDVLDYFKWLDCGSSAVWLHSLWVYVHNMYKEASRTLWSTQLSYHYVVPALLCV